jgi:energy-coupling factor transport system ATP-binding protein
VIRFERVSFAYPGGERPALHEVDLTVPEGELTLVVGHTGSGKSTLLQAVNGLVPRFTGGLLTGTVSVDGRSTADHPPRELADLVGMVGQDPAAGFVTDTVEEELAYAMGNLGIAPDVMRRRVEDALDLLSLHELRQRPLLTLSGGQQQRVAIGAALTPSPRVLVLDEPTSALDPAAAEEVLAALARLVHDLGITVLVAEHRLERVVQYADRLVYLPGDGGPIETGDPATLIATLPIAPPVVELGRLVGWTPVPLTIREARRLASPLRTALSRQAVAPRRAVESSAPPVVHVDGVSMAYGAVVALRGVDLQVRAGEVLAVMGRNGSGKSTLLAQLAGLHPPQVGHVAVDGREPSRLQPHDVIRLVGLVPQDPGLLLNAQTVEAECATNDHDAGLEPGRTWATFARLLAPGPDPSTPDAPHVRGVRPDAHPRDLSEGQRMALALAVVLAPGPAVVVLDEPTRGLDYQAKDHLVEVLADLAASGHAVVLATHDVEVVARVADRVVVLADGEVVADGPAREVVCHSPIFAPQVAKVLAPAEWLTVAEVGAALTAAGVDPRAGARLGASMPEDGS